MIARAGRRLATGLLAAAVILAPARPAAAQAQNPAAPFVGRPVADVRLEIEGEAGESPELLPLIDTPVGQPLRLDQVRSSINRLLSPSLARFDDVVVTAEDVAGGIRLTYRLSPRHPVVDLVISGSPGVDAGELRRQLLARFSGLPPTQRLATVEEAALTLLTNQGYLDARVTARVVESHVPHQAVLDLDVQSGALATVGEVSVTGQSPLPAATVIDRVGARPGTPWRPRDAQTQLAAIADQLRELGYYQAIAQYQQSRNASGAVDVTLVVDAGPQVDLRFTGDPPPGSREDLVPIQRERSADVDLLEDSRRRIESLLEDQGYRDAQAPYTREERNDGALLVITYDITRGPRYRVGRVVWPPDLQLPERTLVEALGVTAGGPYSRAQVTRGMARVRAAYLLQGFHRVEANADDVVVDGATDAGEPLVTIRPAIQEGPRGTIREVTVTYGATHTVPEATLLGVMRSRPGQPFVRLDLARDLQAVTRVYLDRGSRTPSIRIVPDISEDGRDVRLDVEVTEGPQVLVGEIVVVGNRSIDVASVLDEITLHPGQPFGLEAEQESRARLSRLGIFRRVDIIQENRLPGETRATIIVSVEELPATTLGFGGGLEVGRRPRSSGGRLVDRLEFAPRGFFEITRRNLGGRNRQVSLFSRLALKPRTRVDPEDDGPLFGFSEYRVDLTFREERAFGTNTSLLVGFSSEQAIRTSFNFVRRQGSITALRELRPGLSVTGRYALDFSRLFDEAIAPEDQPLIDRLFPQVRLSILSTGVLWDRRNRPLSPTHGTLASADVEVAVRGIGSEVGYEKTFLQWLGFKALSDAPQPRSVVAVRAQLGLARGFERTVLVVDAIGRPVLGPDGQPLEQTVADLPASQRFFAGGSTTVRGFQFDRLGVPEVLNAEGLSVGGNALVVLNAELRTVATTLFGRNLSVVGFVDGGNVFARASDLDLSRIRGAVGFGARYDSPLGPLRLDFGFKLDRRLIGGVRERGWEYHLSIGEIF
ncbi:MAG: BamA/TamA family outer membrane protein [Vicinamibacterales bacterium]